MVDSATHIRLATRADSALILQFIKELAEYEKLAHEVVATEEILAEQLFGPHPYAEVLIAESGGTAHGFCLFFHNFSTFLARPGIYIEDLFVRPAARGLGIGKALFDEIIRLAAERGCGRIEWSVLNWNQTAIDFYKKLGGIAKDEWTGFRMTRDTFEKMAQDQPPPQRMAG